MNAIEPGLRTDLSNADYHALTDWYSSSQLKALLPEHFKAGGSQEALDFGAFFHSAVLEPATVEAQYVALDDTAVWLKADGKPSENPTLTKAWKEAVAEAEADGKSVISKEWMTRVQAMQNAIADHPEAAYLLYRCEGSNEESAFWVDEAGVKHKARFDRRIPGALVDLKSTAAKPGVRSLTSVCIGYGYDVSAAHYSAVAEGLGLGTDTFLHVWVEKTEPYRVTVTELDEQFIKRGMELRAQALERALERAEPYEGATGRLTLFCPEWAIPFEEMEL